MQLINHHYCKQIQSYEGVNIRSLSVVTKDQIHLGLRTSPTNQLIDLVKQVGLSRATLEFQV